MRFVSRRNVSLLFSKRSCIFASALKALITHNPLEYQSEQQKWEAQNKKDLHFKTSEDQGWINVDEAAQGALGVDKATGEKKEDNKDNKNNNDDNRNNNQE